MRQTVLAYFHDPTVPLDNISSDDMVFAVIGSFACKKTERLWRRRHDHGLPPDIEATALRKLTQIQGSRALLDLRTPPGNRLEALKGDRKGQHSLRVNDQWRICFRWQGEEAFEVEIVDYHRP